MRGVLEKIVLEKKREVAERRSIRPIELLKKNTLLHRQSPSMRQSILDGSGVIAEFKRASPSKGVICQSADPTDISQAYDAAGASGISVLTDNTFFKGSEHDLQDVRQAVSLPVLRKDFTIDPYQVYEAKIIGADCILLIAAILSPQQMADLHQLALDLGLEVLVEIHSEEELAKLTGNERIVGINNRNLDTFEVDIENSIRLANKLPDVVKIAESGLGIGSNIKALINAGFHGFLVGESFMKAENPGRACSEFIKQIKQA